MVDFTLVFLVRWALRAIGIDDIYLLHVFDRLPPLLQRSDYIVPESAEFYGTMLFSAGLPEAVTAAVWFVYAVTTLALFGRTLGMSFTGLRLVNIAGNTPNAGLVMLRHILSPLSGIFWIGYVIVMFAPAPGALHDLLTRTRVISTENYSDCRPYPRTPPEQPEQRR